MAALGHCRPTHRRYGQPGHTAGRGLRAVAALGQSRPFPTALPTGCARHSESRSDHLARNHDTCPLILDDVTVHADSARTRDILGLLLKVAELSGPIRHALTVPAVSYR